MKRIVSLCLFLASLSAAHAQPTTTAQNAPVQKVIAAGVTQNDLLGPINVTGNSTVTIKAAATLTNSGTIAGTGTFDFSLGNVVLADNQIGWAKVSKTGSSLADMATRSASDLSSGTLPDARFPTTLPAASGANLTALNATQLTTGTVPDARFPSTLPALNGSLLTALNASQLTSGTVGAARLPAFTGDATSSAGTAALTLATVNSNVGTYGNATQSLTATVDAKGRVTALSAQTVTPAWTSITSKPTTVAGYGITDPFVYTTGSYADPSWITSLAKAKVGLSAADNTSDANKPVSTAQAAAIAQVANARAPLPGMVFDGTAGATVSGVPAFGTGDFAIALWVNPTSFAAYRYLVGSAGLTNTPNVVFRVTTGEPYLYDGTAEYAASPTLTATAGKNNFIVLSRSGTTLSISINGGTASTVTCSKNFSAAIDRIGAYGANQSPHSGFLRALIFTRALSASEVDALYQTQTVPPTDYCNAGTQLITGDDSTFASDTGFWTKNAGATISGGVLNLPVGAYVQRNFGWKVGQKYRLAATITAITSGSVTFNSGSYGSNVLGTAVGPASVDFTCDGTGAFALGIASGGAIDNITLTPIGLVGAWDCTHLTPSSTSAPALPNVNCGPLTWTTGVAPSAPWSGTIPGNVTVTGSDPATASLTLTNAAGKTVSLRSGITGVNNNGFSVRNVTDSVDWLQVNGSGAVTLPVQGIIKGTTTNDNAASGYVGEYVEVEVPYGSKAANSDGTARNAASVTLTAGDWNVWGTVGFEGTGATVSVIAAGISTTSATLSGRDDIFQQIRPYAVGVTGNIAVLATPAVRVSIPSTTTVYLVSRASFSGTLDSFGTIRARRIR